MMNNKTVLIFDDDEDILEVCSIILTQHGFTIHTQINCEAIEEKISAASPDVILLDNQILPLGGIVAARSLAQSALHQHIPIVYFSANKDVASLADAAGAHYFIEKPFELDDLVRIVEKAISEYPANG
ncbi:MAG: response regulator [Chitinophagaceae bacterium]